MSTVNVWNSMKTPVKLKLFGQVTDHGGHGDFATQQTRGIPTGALNDIELPGRGAVTTLDATFWSQWSAQNANFVRRHLVYQVG